MAEWGSPVRVAYAATQVFNPSGGVSISYSYVLVRVDNFGYQKQVLLHAPVSVGWWQQHELVWVEGRGDHDLFATVPNMVPAVTEFAVSYTVNGRTYWDSRLGENYRLGTLNTAVAGNIAVVSVLCRLFGQSGIDVTGDIYVNNLSAHKEVGIRLSADGGIVWQDVPAAYAGPATEQVVVNLGAVERWRFDYAPSAAVQQPLTFAAYYRDHQVGVTYWDNNFGHNYSLWPRPGADVR
jgi:hypothetical protein